MAASRGRGACTSRIRARARWRIWLAQRDFDGRTQIDYEAGIRWLEKHGDDPAFLRGFAGRLCEAFHGPDCQRPICLADM